MASLPWRARIYALRILSLSVLAEVGLRTVPLPKLARWMRVDLDLESQNLGQPLQAELPEWAVRRMRMTWSVLRYFDAGPTCLRNSLVAASCLRELSPKLRIGVRRADSVLSAHAWLELDGHYFDPEASAYSPIHKVGD